MKIQDLAPDPFPGLKWEPGKLSDAVEELRKYAVNEAERSIAWYYAKRGAKKWGLRFFRGGAIVLTAVAGVLPPLSQMQNWQANGKAMIDPLWSTIAVALAATLLLLDRFSGCTSAFVRYLLTAQELSQSLEEFRFDFETERISWNDIEPRPDRAAALVSRTKAFLLQLHATIRHETNTWSAEFHNVVKQIDESGKTVTEVARSGAIKVHVANGEQLSEGWRMSVDGGPERLYKGTQSAILSDLAPGIHRVRVVAQINGVEKSKEEAPIVRSGEVKEVPFTLN